MSAMIQFEPSANAIINSNEKTKSTSVRLLTAKEYKENRGLKGQEGKRAYNAYIREQGKANTAGLAAALTSGELLVKGFNDYRTSFRVSFVKASSLREPATKSPKIGLSREAALRALGLTETQLALALKTA